MLRLTLILCIGMYAALMIAGKDRGQLRPGLARAAAMAAAQGEKAGSESDSQQSKVVATAQSATETIADTPVTKAATTTVAKTGNDVVAHTEPKTYVEPAREVVTTLEDPVFSLSTIGNEAVPSSEPVPEVLESGEGTIWYVNASSVNVRAEPSTDAEVVGKLVSGEATLVVQAVDNDWARIVIQGDGVEGFVALRYLSAEAP